MRITAELRELDCPNFAALVGISRQKAAQALKNCHDGRTWRGVKLDVLLVKGSGGRQGLQYLVRRDSIPPEFLKARAEDTESTTDTGDAVAVVASAPTVEATSTGDLLPEKPPIPPRRNRHYKKEVADFKWDLVQRVRQETGPGTAVNHRRNGAISSSA